MSQKEKSDQPLLGKNGFAYKEQYGVIVICKDAAHQEQVYRQLKEQGHKLKVVAV